MPSVPAGLPAVRGGCAVVCWGWGRERGTGTRYEGGGGRTGQRPVHTLRAIEGVHTKLLKNMHYI